jgi:flagellar hook-length control protein FliK
MNINNNNVTAAKPESGWPNSRPSALPGSFSLPPLNIAAAAAQTPSVLEDGSRVGASAGKSESSHQVAGAPNGGGEGAIENSSNHDRLLTSLPGLRPSNPALRTVPVGDPPAVAGAEPAAEHPINQDRKPRKELPEPAAETATPLPGVAVLPAAPATTADLPRSADSVTQTGPAAAATAQALPAGAANKTVSADAVGRRAAGASSATPQVPAKAAESRMIAEAEFPLAADASAAGFKPIVQGTSADHPGDLSSDGIAEPGNAGPRPAGVVLPQINSTVSPSLPMPAALEPGAASASTLAVEIPLSHPDWSEALGHQVLWALGQGVQQAQIYLHPQDLGPVSIQIRVEDQKTHVTFSASHAATCDALQAALPQLRQMFLQQGLNLGQANILALPQYSGSGQSAPLPGAGSGRVARRVVIGGDSAAARGAMQLRIGLLDDYA